MLSRLRPASAVAALVGGLLVLSGAWRLATRAWAHLDGWLFGRLPYGPGLGHLALLILGTAVLTLALRSARRAGDPAGQGR
ncbi:hypothetical protein ABZ368_11100 [Streptomyces sp. NPDC005908]|uniref:hypothetical protein n=1 Tax=unclassified Streptomyces TaxID=2593676 RepID=UPI0011A6C466|nr:hypothetical protein [Streptomyces sp. T12]TWD13010.1 hypothetical protein FB570_12067 [Streptomyces sp. T12]